MSNRSSHRAAAILRLLVIGDQVIGVRRENQFDFRTNVASGGTCQATELTAQQIAMAKQICHSIGLKFASVDLIDCKDGEPKVLEVNAIPGWKGAQRVCPVEYCRANHPSSAMRGSGLPAGAVLMDEQSVDGNVAARLRIVTAIAPGAVAIAEPDGPPRSDGSRSYSLTTFGSLDERSDAIARGLIAWGVRPGMRMAMLVPFGAAFIELVFALMKAGVVTILIDPGMGRKHLVRCLSEAEPDGFVGIPKAQAIRTLLRGRFRKAKWNVTLGRRLFWGGKTLQQIAALGNASVGEIEFPRIERSDEAAIIFTTGSTGPPKGVLYTHGTFHAQIDRIRERYDIHRGSRDLACFPLFGLFDAVMGVTTIIPDMDPTRPADVNPQRLVEAAAQWEVDQAFGSPALWNTVVRWAEANEIQKPFPTLRRILSAGAPVPASTLEKLRTLVDAEANIVTPYGAHRSTSNRLD